MSSISINGNSYNLSSPTASSDATKTNYIVIQGDVPLKRQQKVELAKRDVEIHEYLGKDAYLCRFTPKRNLDEINELTFVRSAVVYPSDLKTSSMLKGAARASNSTTSIPVVILLHKDGSPSSEVAESLMSLPGVQIDTLETAHRRLRVTVEARALTHIQGFDSVLSIEKDTPMDLCNDKARVDIDAALDVNSILCDGFKQVVAVADTGFDLGSLTDVHPAFSQRVIALLAVSGSNTNDPIGHGTHVAGSILGNGESPYMGGVIQGTAPRANLVLQSLLTDEGAFQTPPNIYSLFQQAYGQYVARVHSNSWGPDWDSVPYQVEYDNLASAVDSFVWDNPDCVICFAAGNSGEKSDAGVSQIGSSAAAKNCITVGACYSSRPTSEYRYDPTSETAVPLAEVAPFSSRGPTIEGRLKPDLVAPGVAILSACSRDPDVPSKFKTQYGESSDPLWAFDTGTSMATPLVAGCVASLRQALLSIGTETPSAALIKALLINGTCDLQAQHGMPTLGPPNNSQGFGRIDLSHSFKLPNNRPEEGFVDAKGLKEDEVWQHQIPATHVSGSLKVTLAYSDRAGPALQNKLVLSVLDSSGNGIMGDDGVLTENNVQQVSWKDVPKEAMSITVKAERITRPDDAQPFSVVWTMF